MHSVRNFKVNEELEIVAPLCRWLSDKTSPVAVMLTGLLISVVPFVILGPSPFIEPLFRKLHIFGPWHVWLGLVFLGSGCAMGLMPVLPAVLASAGEVNSEQ